VKGTGEVVAPQHGVAPHQTHLIVHLGGHELWFRYVEWTGEVVAPQHGVAPHQSHLIVHLGGGHTTHHYRHQSSESLENYTVN